MRRLLFVCVLLGANAAAAPTWSDWVGEYRGSLSWRGCTAPGAASATVVIDAIDGAMTVDLTRAGAALRAYGVQQSAAGRASAQDGDVMIEVTSKRNAIELAVAIGEGCTLRGTLARTSSKVPTCDALLGWARIESKCTKTETRLEDFAKLASTTWRAKDAARCSARAEKLALAMVDAGCAPHPDRDIGTRATECRSLADATNKLARCGRVPREIVQRLSNNANALSAASQTAEKATLPYVERQCKDARIEMNATAVQFQCQL